MAEVERITKIQENSLKSASYREILAEVEQFDSYVSTKGLVVEKKRLILTREEVYRYNVRI